MATQVGNVIFAISADLKSLQGQLRTMEGQFSSSFGKIEGVIGAANRTLGLFGVGFGVGALVQLGREAFNLADNLQNLHEQTGISVQLLSGLKSPLEEAGSSMDAFGRGVFNLQKNLGNVDKETDPAALAIKRLGLNIDELRNTNPDDFIKKVTDALGTIENPIERNTVLFNLLGKSAKELGPAFQQLVGRIEEFRNKGLTAEDVKILDEAGDAWTRFSNKIKIGTASAFSSAIKDLETITQLIRLNLGLLRKEGGLGGAIGSMADVLSQPGIVKPLPKAEPFKGLDRKKEGKTDAEKAQDQTESFLAGLERELTSIQVRAAEIQFGPEAGIITKLDAELQAFKDKLIAEKLPIPKGLEAAFETYKQKIVETTDKVAKLKQEMEALQALGKILNQDSAEWLNVDADLAKAQEKAKGLREEFEKIRTTLAIEAIDTSTPAGRQEQRRQRATVEATEAAKKIEEAGRAAGVSQEEIAGAVALAWTNAFKDVEDKVEETTTFQQRAFERMHDAIGDATKDLVSGQIKSWDDLGNRVADVLQSITAEFLAMQAKLLFFGEEFGGKTGGTKNIGGILGSILGAFGGGSSAPTSQMSGAFDFELAAGLFHSGGVVGDSAGQKRSVPMAIFAHAPRYHGGGWAGLRPDEMPIIAQKGERILPRWESAGGMADTSGGSGSGEKTRVIINNNTGQPAEVERRRGSDGVEEVLVLIGQRQARDIRAGRDQAQAISQTFGLNRAPINRG